MPLSRTTMFAIAALVLMLSVRARGQGTNEQFCDPMSFDVMTRLLEPLALSEAQAAVAASAHEVYLEQYLDLRHGKMNAWLEEFGNHGWGHGSTRDTIEEAIRRRKAIMNDIRQLDQAFFGQVAECLSDEQEGRLSRIVERRARDRIEHDATWSGWGRPSLDQLDLVEHMVRVDFPQEVLAQVDSLVAAYEAQLGPIWRAVWELRLRMPLSWHDAAEERRALLEERMAPLRDASRGAAEGATEEEIRHEVEDVLDQIDLDAFTVAGPNAIPEQERIGMEIARASRLNRRFLDDLRARIDAELATRLEKRYVNRAYGMLGIPGDRLAAPVSQYLQKHPEGDIPEALRALQRDHDARRRAEIWKLIEAAEQEGFASSAPFVFRPGAGADVRAEAPTKKHRNDLKALNDSSLQQYASITGEEVPRTRGHRIMVGDTSIMLSSEDGTPGEPIAISIETDGAAISGAFILAETALPRAPNATVDVIEAPAGDALISLAGDLSWAADDGDGAHRVFLTRTGGNWFPGPADDAIALEMAGSDETARELVGAVHADYEERFERLSEQTLKPAAKAVRRSEPDAGSAHAGVRSAMESVRSLDREYLSDARRVCDDVPEHLLVRANARREFASYGRAGRLSTMHPASGSRESEVDLWRIAREALGASIDGDAASILDEWVVAAADLRRERWSSRLGDAERAAEARASSDGQPSFWGAANASDRSARFDADLSSLARTTIARLAGVLGRGAHGRLEAAYLEAAYPMVYRGASSLDGAFDRALALGGDVLAARARDAILDLRMEYDGQSRAIGRRMVERVRTFDDRPLQSGAFEMADHEAFGTLHQELEADRFERRNLDQRVRASLESLLGDLAASVLGESS